MAIKTSVLRCITLLAVCFALIIWVKVAKNKEKLPSTQQAAPVLPSMQNQTLWETKLPPECSDLWLRSPMEYDTVVGYFHKAGSVSSALHTVLITQCTVDRLPRLERLAKSWGGPVSVAMYVPTDTTAVQQHAMVAIDQFAAAISQDGSFVSTLTISVLFGLEKSPWKWNCSEPEWEASVPLYPVNALRNLAVAATANLTISPALNAASGSATGPLLFLLDVDFVPSVGLAQWLQNQIIQNSTSSEAALIAKGDVIVIPAFEANHTTEFPDSDALTLEYLKRNVKNKYALTPFHLLMFPAGHKPSNYTRWMELLERTEPELYKIEHAERYEPYVIISRDWFVPYDERFRGFGLNKVVQLRSLSDCGAQFHVLSKHFVAAKAHHRSAMFQVSFRAHGRKFISNVYSLYTHVLGEVGHGGLPALSNGTARMFGDNGLQHMMTRCAGRP